MEYEKASSGMKRQLLTDDTNGQRDPWEQEGSEGSFLHADIWSTGKELQVAAAGLGWAGLGC